jgi:hypothetical protein
MSEALCPNCDQLTSISDSPKLGENVTCKNCGIESIIVWLNPIELDLPYYDYLDDDDEYTSKYDKEDALYSEDYTDYP